MNRYFRKCLAASCLVATSLCANAGVIISADSAMASSVWDSTGTYSVSNTIDQSGLSITYNSGVDDFDTYLAQSPMHSLFANTEWFSLSGVQSASLVYDLGQIYDLDAVALWVEDAWAPPTDVSFLVSTDGVNFTTISGGLSLPDFSGDYPATRYGFSTTSARYFSIEMGACSTQGCSLGEIAFSAVVPAVNPTPVPEPSSIFVLALGLIGVAARKVKIRN